MSRQPRLAAAEAPPRRGRRLFTAAAVNRSAALDTTETLPRHFLFTAAAVNRPLGASFHIPHGERAPRGCSREKTARAQGAARGAAQAPGCRHGEARGSAGVVHATQGVLRRRRDASSPHRRAAQSGARTGPGPTGRHVQCDAAPARDHLLGRRRRQAVRRRREAAGALRRGRRRHRRGAGELGRAAAGKGRDAFSFVEW